MRAMIRRKNQRGDTIVEVLFATAALSLVIVISFMVMNRGVGIAQLAVENTFVRQSMDGQAEALRFLRDAYLNSREADSHVRTEWAKIEDRLVGEATPFGGCEPSGRAFYVNTDTVTVQSNLQPAITFAGAEFGQGLWVEAVQPTIPAGQPEYIDFHIRACWDPPIAGPKATTGTIVRLYVSE